MPRLLTILDTMKRAFGRVTDIPETLAHIGVTKRYEDFLIAALAYHMTGIVSTAYGTPTIKVVRKLIIHGQ